MYTRFTTVRGDPDKIDSAVDRVDGELRAQVEATPGNRGFAVLVDVSGGRILGASYWDGSDSMRASEASLAGSRAAAAAALAGEISMERFEVAVGFRHTIPARGAVARLTRTRVEPARVDDHITQLEQEALPKIKGAPGLCSFQLLVDRDSGAGMIVTAWENQASAEAFAPTAEQLRARAADRVGIRFDQPETMTLIRSTVRLD